MKVKYLGTLFAASLLSLGLITSCATPDTGETEVEPDAGVVEPDTGAEGVNPDAGQVEPPEGQTDPGATDN